MKLSIKIKINLIIILIGTILLLSPFTYAYWNQSDTSINKEDKIYTKTLKIGSWLKELIPGGYVEIFGGETWVVKKGQYFIYEGNLYIANENFSPEYNGVPSNLNQWAWRVQDLEFNHQAIYNKGSVVRLNGMYYLKIDQDNFSDPSEPGNTGVLNMGFKWIHIQPMEDYMFYSIGNSFLRNYSEPIMGKGYIKDMSGRIIEVKKNGNFYYVN